jgi:hypothetical protein
MPEMFRSATAHCRMLAIAIYSGDEKDKKLKKDLQEILLEKGFSRNLNGLYFIVAVNFFWK